jgi:hypothetical protein
MTLEPLRAIVKRSLEVARVVLATLSTGLSDLSGTFVVLDISTDFRAAAVGWVVMFFLTDSNTDMLDLLLVMNPVLAFFVDMGGASLTSRCFEGECCVFIS